MRNTSDVRIGSKIKTKHPRATESIEWTIVNITEERAIKGRYLHLESSSEVGFRSRMVHESSEYEIVSIPYHNAQRRVFG